MSLQTIILTYNPNTASGGVPEDKYWLTIEQVVEDEKATVEFVAETIDALFDLSLCVEEEGDEPEDNQPVDVAEFDSMEEILDKIGEKTSVEMAACEMLRMGTYQAQLKIVRSHPELPYTLRLSVGTILETVIVEEPVSANIKVNSSSSAVLPYPAMSGLRCSWIGSVIGPSGVIPPPAIQSLGNTLFWEGTATGVIRAEFNTFYNLVTVEIPGVPNYEGAELGDPQNSTALAFYHYLVYQASISPPAYDEDLLEEVCGYSSSTGIGLEDPEEPLPEPPPPPEEKYGCVDYFPLNHPIYEPGYYEDICCVPGDQHDGCWLRKTKKEGGKGLSQEIINRMTAEWPGPIEFIGLGPITPEGCGANYETTQVIPKACCDGVSVLVFDEVNSVSVLAPGTSGVVYFTGGTFPVTIKIRGNGFSLDGYNLRDGIIYGPHQFFTVYAHEGACGTAPIILDDGCSVVRGGVRSTNGNWQLYWESDIARNFYAEHPDIYLCVTNSYTFDSTVNALLPWYFGGEFLLCRGNSITPTLTPHGWSKGSGKNCSLSSGLVGTIFSDPYGLFSWVGISDQHYIDNGNPPYYRLFVEYPKDNGYFQIWRWVC